MSEPEDDSELRQDLTALLNRHSRENGSDTPDFILAEHLLGCLKTFDTCLDAREVWYGRRIGERGGASRVPGDVEARS